MCGNGSWILSSVKYSPVTSDDVVLYKEVGAIDGCDLIQEDLNGVCSWANKWQLRLNPSKCEALAITRKRSPLVYTYYINSAPLSWRSVVRYLGIYINSTLSWSDHCKVVAAKATKCLNFLRHTMWGATPAAKAMAYKCIIRPLMEYSCQVWNPFTDKDISMLEKVQRRASRWACGSRWVPHSLAWSKCSDTCLRELGWPLLSTRRNYLSVRLLHDIMHNRYFVKFSEFCTFVSSCTRHHSLAIVPSRSTINAFRYSFFVNVPFIWNTIATTQHTFIAKCKQVSFCP